ncbi:MAG: S-adenosylmethionine:tRNA ribosyltransferase-isomerase [Betaproteobacteria bacterium ADurb.Bin341]|nr:MAG: S-adenosylmethionine:tRNA ribosyltransferase-isomerase [Betaproteobacteria bacterium ADurb.Bin341]
MPYTLDDFDYELPAELIAQQPAAERAGSRLLHVTHGLLSDRQFADLPELLAPGDLLVFNDTRVIKARFFGRKASGGRVEVLLERIIDPRHALAQVRASKSPKPETLLCLEEAFEVRVVGREGEFFRLELVSDGDFWQHSEAHGRLPLPPYINHAAEPSDETRYQTIYARQAGAVAAPTAGLHFDAVMLDRLQQQGVRTAFLTLHVGAGTFQPVRVHQIAQHRMHCEQFDLTEATARAVAETRAAGGRIIAVGTTSLRALESAALADGSVRSGASETDIFITPGFRFRVVDCLITNFHLPKSTLLMLVSAFAGLPVIRNAYAHAIDRAYRFFSYGDAMLLEKQKE